MIHFSIVKNKPHLPVAVPPGTPPVFGQQQGVDNRVQQSRQWAGRGNIGQPRVCPTALSYVQYIMQCPIKEGMFIVNKLYDTSHLKEGLQPYWGMNYVLNVEVDFERLPLVWHLGHPKAFRIIQVFDNSPSPHIRWDSWLDFRPMSDAEYEKLIKPRYDQLQDYFAKFRFQFGPNQDGSKKPETD